MNTLDIIVAIGGSIGIGLALFVKFVAFPRLERSSKELANKEIEKAKQEHSKRRGLLTACPECKTFHNESTDCPNCKKE